ncbi:MAG TPA: trypsin-like peptidase domain-containing protein [Armatimonadota bacterium]|jgi:serine protease Do
MKLRKNVLFFLLGGLVAYIAFTVFQTRPQGSYTVLAQGRLQPDEQITIDVVKKVTPAVVSITTSGIVARESWFGIVQDRAEGQGSGVIVRPDGYILTNRHVISIEGAVRQTVTVILPSGKTYKDARVLGADPRLDLAVVKIPARDLPVAALGDSASLQVGQKTIAVGNPLGLSQTVTSGIVSAMGRSIQGEAGMLEGLIQTDAAINPGNSGGALVDSSGRLIGVNTAIAQLGGGGNIGIGFAVPINTARAILDDIAKYGRVRIPWDGLGQQVDVQPAWQQAYGLPNGVLVRPIPGGPADRAGLREYDVITKADGKAVDTRALQEALNHKNIGDKVVFTVFREGKTLSITLTLPERPGALGT